MSIRDHLLEIKQKRGELSPKIVVEEVKDINHPLHHRFDWDNNIAGDNWREYQARKLIQSVEVEYRKPDGSEGRVREFYSVKRGDNFVFESIDDLQKDPLTTEIVIRQMQREFADMKARYEGFAEFWALLESEIAVKK